MMHSQNFETLSQHIDLHEYDFDILASLLATHVHDAANFKFRFLLLLQLVMQTFNVPAIYVFVISEEFEHVIQREWVKKHVQTTETYQDNHLCVLNVRRKDSEIVDINLT